MKQQQTGEVASDACVRQALRIHPARSGKKVRILFIHQGFPAQFRYVAPYLAQRDDVDVQVICHRSALGLPGITTHRYDLHRNPGEATHHYVKDFEREVIFGQAVAKVLVGLARQGYRPDVIIAHPAWGETLYVKEVFPQARLVYLFEYYYRRHGADVGFDPEFPANFDAGAWATTRNANNLLNLEACDVGVASTQWQRSLQPTSYQHKIHVVHDGIDTDFHAPDPQARFTLPDGRIFKVGDPLVSYVARNLEPGRGFHSFMRSVPHILKARHDTHIVILGGDGTNYGPPPKDAAHWREKLLREIALNAEQSSRLHVLGSIPSEQCRQLMQVSAAHVFLTYPYYLSWSIFEAMSTGCLFIGSATDPVRELIKDGINGLLADFFDYEGIAGKVNEALANQQRLQPLRQAARQTIVEGYSRQRGIEGYLKLIGCAMECKEMGVT